MSQATKRLKMCCFATIAAGMLALVAGVASVVFGAASLGGYLVLASGLIAIAFSLWAARAANVPSRSPSIVKASLIVTLACSAVLAVGLLAVEGGLQAGLVAVDALVIVCLLAVCICARQVVHEQDAR